MRARVADAYSRTSQSSSRARLRRIRSTSGLLSFQKVSRTAQDICLATSSGRDAQ
jgi:hypothetical protein